MAGNPRKLTHDELTEIAKLLVDADGAARLLGLSDGRAVRAYASMFDDFPAPLVPAEPERKPRNTRYWWVPHLEAWRDAHPPRARNRDDVTPPS